MVGMDEDGRIRSKSELFTESQLLNKLEVLYEKVNKLPPRKDSILKLIINRFSEVSHLNSNNPPINTQTKQLRLDIETSSGESNPLISFNLVESDRLSSKGYTLRLYPDTLLDYSNRLKYVELMCKPVTNRRYKTQLIFQTMGGQIMTKDLRENFDVVFQFVESTEDIVTSMCDDVKLTMLIDYFLANSFRFSREKFIHSLNRITDLMEENRIKYHQACNNLQTILTDLTQT